MGTSLTGKNISASYLGLLKTTDNAIIGSTAKRLTDGGGTDSPLYLSTTRLGIGITPTSVLHVNGDANINGLTIGLGGGGLTNNIAFGEDALLDNTTGEALIGIGERALTNNTTGNNNIAIGFESLEANTTNNDNIGIGYRTLYLANGGNRNIAIGSYSSDAITTGYDNISIGVSSLGGTTTGYRNIAIGYQTIYNSTTAERNVVIGYGAHSSMSDGKSQNTSIGYNVVTNLGSGDANTSIGSNAGLNLTSGSNNILIGAQAGSATGHTSYSNNVIIGAQANAEASGDSNEIVIGYNTTGNGSNTVTIGNSSITANHFSGKIYFGGDLSQIDNNELRFYGSSGKNISNYGIGTSLTFKVSNTASADTDVLLFTNTGNATIFKNLTLSSYGSGTITGTATQRLGVDSSGNVIEIPIGAGAVDGVGATGQASFWTDSDTISGDDDFYWDNTNKRLGIGTNSPDYDIHSESSDDSIITTRTTANDKSAMFITWNNNASSGNNMQLRSYGAGQTGTVFGNSISKANMLWSNGDSLMAIGTIGSTPLIFGTGNSENMRLDSSGDLSIGVTSSSARLTVKDSSDSGFNSGIAIIRSANTQTGYINMVGGAMNFNSPSIPITFRQSGSEIIRIDSSGNVGIGTTSVTSGMRLDVQGGDFRVGDDANQGFEAGWSAGAGVVFLQGYNRGTSSFLDMKFNNAVTITSGGSVGIGTASPGAKLDIHTATNTNGILIKEDTDDTITHNFYIDGSDNGVAVLYADGQSAKIQLNTAGDSYFNGGNVGINQSSPSSFFSNASQLVIGDGSTSRGMTIYGISTGDSQIFFADGTTGDQQYRGILRYEHSSDSMVMFTSATERARLDSSGNLAIGSTSAVNKLHIEGSTDGLGLAIKNTGTGGRTYGIQSTGNTSGYGQGKLAFVDESVGARMVIDSSGSVGIGTSSPAIIETSSSATGNTVGALLTNTNGSGTADSVSLNFGLGRSADSYIRSIPAIKLLKEQQWTGTASTVDASLVFSTVSDETTSERMRIDSSGNVGIGTSSPAYELVVNDETGSSVIQLRTGTTTSENNILFGDSDSSAQGRVQYNHTGDYLALWTAGSEKMRLDSSGRLGLGVSSPSSKLHVVDDANGFIARFTGGTVGDVNIGIFANSASNFGSIGTESADRFSLFTSGIDRLNVSADGNVGIGGTPNMKLNIHHADQDGLRFNCADDLETFIDFGDASDNDIGRISYDHADNHMAFRTNNAERLRITSGGNFLVNCTALPDSTVEGFVITGTSSGNRSSSGSSTTSYNHLLFYNGNGLVGSISTGGSTTAYNTSSDYRLKEDLQDFNALEIASKIKMYDFKWKADDSRSYGVMAHELEEVLPQAVTGEKDGENMQQVDYSKLVPILLKSIQELEARVKELEKNK